MSSAYTITEIEYRNNNLDVLYSMIFHRYRVQKVSLDSHNTSGLADADTEKRLANQRKHIEKLLLLRRFSEAWLFCDAVDEVDMWKKMGETAVAELNVEFGRKHFHSIASYFIVIML